MSRYNITTRDYRALARFRYELRKFLKFSEERARAHSLDPVQYQLLLAIRGLPQSEEPSIGRLAEEMQIRHHSAVELVDRMQARGLVARVRCPDDRRRRLIEITPAGDEVLSQLSRDHLEELRSAAPSLISVLQDAVRSGRPAEAQRD